MPIERCTEEDLPVLSGLFRELYPSNPRLQERDYFDWQYRNSPWNSSGDYTFLVQREPDGIAAFLGYVPVEVEDGERIARGCWLQQWHSVTPAATPLALLGKASEGIPYRFMLDSASDSQRLFRALRLSEQSPMPRWVALPDPEAARELFELCDPELLRQLEVSAARYAAVDAPRSFQHVTRLDRDAVFPVSGLLGVRAAVRRTGAYLNWRYVEIPRHNYRLMVGPDDSLVVYREERLKGQEEYGVARVMEWCVPPEHAESAFVSLREELRDRSIVLLDFFCTSSFAEGQLRPVGFLNAGELTESIPHLFRPLYRRSGYTNFLTGPAGATRDFSAWMITKGDSDLDRIKL